MLTARLLCSRVSARGMATENSLGRELSPYLLQHRHNPVQWQPWGSEAIQQARQENKGGCSCVVIQILTWIAGQTIS